MVAPDRSSSKRRGLARLKIGLHIFPSEENQPRDASCNRNKIQEYKKSFEHYEFPARGVDVSGHAQRGHGFCDAEGHQQSAEDQRGDTGPAPDSQQSDSGSDAPASEGKSPNYAVGVEICHFSVSSRLEFEHKNSEHEKGVASDRQDSGDLDSPVDLAVRRKIGGHGEEFAMLWSGLE